MSDQQFDAALTDALKDIEARAMAVGWTISDVCSEAGVSRATPHRWKHKTPETVVTVVRLQQAVGRAELAFKRLTA